MNMGWICPRCHAAHAPSVQKCECQPFGATGPLYPIRPIPNTVWPGPTTLSPMPGCGCTGPCGNSACPHLPRATCSSQVVLCGRVN